MYSTPKGNTIVTIDRWEEQQSTGREVGNENSGEDGEQYLMDKRKRMDRGNKKNIGSSYSVNKSQKRGNNDQLENTKRSKRRKYALVGEQWGTEKGTVGLGRKLEEDEKETNSYSSTGPWNFPGPSQARKRLIVIQVQVLGTSQAWKGVECEGPLLECTVKEGEHTVTDLETELEGTDSYSGTGPLILQGPRQKIATQTLLGVDCEGPLLEPMQNEGEHTVTGRENDRGRGRAEYLRTGPLLEHLPGEGPMLELDGEGHTLEPDDRGGQSPKEPNPGTLRLDEGEAATKDLGNNDDGGSLYDTASTVLRLREDRGECEVRRGWCEKHDRKANKITSKKKVWTKMRKTGLFQYCTRKMSVWRCDSSTPTLVGTMGQRDGAGVTSVTNGTGS